ncbi:unnamed protein product [Protopolystoma xenopodis]|uniref:Uncharacterized protein n=1 Tax=Protopolystoma xenopodis TaxID=117903 RepID=A0A448XH79_9PLAT|nr:unnamed protein product [Protopolystoma xenopodis]
MRAWSRSPSPANRTSLRGHPVRSPESDEAHVLHQLNRSGAGTGTGPLRAVNPVASHMERSRAALEQLVEQDRNRRRAKESERQQQPQDGSNSRRSSPAGFYSPDHKGSSAERYRDELADFGAVMDIFSG